MNRKHGHTMDRGKTPTYVSWSMMIRRTSPTGDHAKWYADRGITVCERWRDFPSFLADMGERPDSTSLDRIDNNGNYEPGNCRWATRREQRNNRRKQRPFVLDGKEYTLPELCDIYSVPYQRVSKRLLAGWSLQEALSTPRGPTGPLPNKEAK